MANAIAQKRSRLIPQTEWTDVNISLKIFAASMMLFAMPVTAASRSDFGAFAMCAKLKAMPKGYRAIKCNARTPLRGECRFTLPGDLGQIEYLIENGKILDKTYRFKAGTSAKGPFGLTSTDTKENAARKIRSATGLSTQMWTDSSGDTGDYLQSDGVPCSGNEYTIYVWFENNQVNAVSVSSLPAI
jgi:hypothetical protein